ncbi:MAG: bifunctional 4'-phosphopantothenoylcysteine decarboxylase/phosphopantothenoylcysteine synthetase, partial [Candidatus Omnitrophica bacterium]|nr:bifunctional 4'-phosphopantothenoylcysteine decarboxylase/phosphopantothenoylcysteine synthetase [Candidatus Omnitrophota bacterium]
MISDNLTAKEQQKKILKILVSAGPTCEPLDPVRFISNYSTGVLGYTIAREARKRGHRV